MVLISGLWRKEPQSDLPMLSETKESNQGVSEDERRRIPGEVTGSDGAGHGSRNQGRKSWVGAEIKGAPANTHILPCLVQPWIVFQNYHRKNPRSRIIVNLNRWLLCWKYCCNPMAKAVIHGNKPEANIPLDFWENFSKTNLEKKLNPGSDAMNLDHPGLRTAVKSMRRKKLIADGSVQPSLLYLAVPQASTLGGPLLPPIISSPPQPSYRPHPTISTILLFLSPYHPTANIEYLSFAFFLETQPTMESHNSTIHFSSFML